MRKSYLQEWEKKHAFDPQFSAAQGRSVTDPVCRSSFRSEVGYNLQQSCLGSIWDITKAYECVRHEKLRETGEAHHYPLVLLRLDLNSYSWPRRLVLDKAVSRPIFPGRSMIAGSSGATFQLKCYMLSDIRKHCVAHPHVPINLHIDDITQECQHSVETVCL